MATSTGRKLIFSTIPTLVLLVGLEVGVRSCEEGPPAGAPAALPLGLNLFEPLFVKDPSRQLWVPNREEMSRFTGLPVQVRTGRLRVAMFGGSTVATPRPTGPAWQLAALLSLGSGGRSDLINAGGKGFGSARIRRVVEELGQRRLDAVLLYTGHNEFMEHKFVFGTLPLWLGVIEDGLDSYWKSWAWIRGVVFQHQGPARGSVQQMHTTPLHAGERAMLLARFRRNLTDIARTIQEMKAGAVWVLPASNLTTPPHDTGPGPTVTEPVRVSYLEFQREARDALVGERSPEVIRAAEGMLKIDPAFCDGSSAQDNAFPWQALPTVTSTEPSSSSSLSMGISMNRPMTSMLVRVCSVNGCVR